MGIGLALGVVLVEGLLRVFGLASPEGVATVNSRDFASIPGIFAPNQVVRNRQNSKLPHMVAIDSLGYRGRDLPRAKPTGEFRILFAGDSYTYGAYVNDDQTVPANLETRLRARCPGARVINAGLGGSTIVDQRHLITRGLALHPDLVILMFAENDVSDLVSIPMWQRLARNRVRKSRFPLSLVYPVMHRTALWNLLLRARAKLEAGADRKSLEVATKASGSTRPTGLRARYRSLLEEAVRILRDEGIPLHLASMPSHLTVSGARPEEQLDWFRAMADSLGLALTEVLTAMRQSGHRAAELYLLPHDGHASPLGNAIAAEAIDADLEPEGQTPACLAPAGVSP